MARKAAGFNSARHAALECDWAESSYRAHERGSRTIGQDDARRYIHRFTAAGAQGYTAQWVLFGDGDAHEGEPGQLLAIDPNSDPHDAERLGDETQKQQFHPTFVRQWRKYRNLTLDQLAERADLTQSYLSLLERGQRGYAQNTLQAIAATLQVDVGKLLTVDPTTNSDLKSRDPCGYEFIWSIWDRAKPAERELIVKIATAILGEPHHKKEDWLTEFVRDRSPDENKRIKQMLEAAFPQASKGA